MKNIVAIDTSHLLYRHFYAIVQKKPASQITKKDLELASKNARDEIDSYNKKLKPTDNIIAAFDDRSSWRTRYTQSHDLPDYKSSRRKKRKLKQKRVDKIFDKFRNSFKSQLSKDKNITVMFGDNLEADDILAGLARRKADTDRLSIISLDHDMRQLNYYKNVNTIDMRDGSVFKISRAEANYQRFYRAVRGRYSYNVGQIFDRIGDDKIRELYNDPDEFNQWLDDQDATQLFKHNKVLYDMVDQPKVIQAKIETAIILSYKKQR